MSDSSLGDLVADVIAALAPDPLLQHFREMPPVVTAAEKAMRRWPEREARRRPDAPRPPFEGHRRQLGE